MHNKLKDEYFLLLLLLWMNFGALFFPQVHDKLHEADKHLRSGNMRTMAGDARVTVASVEAMTLSEQLQVHHVDCV
jgi:hypothetical protein